MLHGKCRGCHSATPSDLLIDVGDVAVDGRHGHDQLGGNLSRRPPASQSPQDFDLGRG
jgi:hypothetical protein